VENKAKIRVGLATICSNQQKTTDVFELVLQAENQDFDLTKIDPGQFVCLAPLAQESSMARPFSIAMVSTFHNTFSILYKVVGENTKLLSQLKKGDQIKFWGPLGNGFIPDPDVYDEVWLVGGGIGIAPLCFMEKVVAEYQEGRTRIFYGSRTKDDVIPLTFYTGEHFEIATDDGSFGVNGFITDLFGSFADEARGQNILVITCGPNIMMSKVAEICAKHNFDCYVILERIMACGIGACLGCSIKTKSGMKRICHDGPVFPAEEVIWNELG